MKSRWPWFAALLLLALGGFALQLYVTRSGPGIRGDSVRYVMGARNLLAGHGFSRVSGGGELFPETGFAPLLSFLLAGFGALGIDMFAGARFANALLFAGSVLLTGALIWAGTRSGPAALLGSALVLTAPNVVEWHALLMSEGLFIFLAMLALSCLYLHLKTGRTDALLLGALAAGAAALARYVGVSLIPVGGLAILLWGPPSRKERWSRAAAFCSLAILPFALWMIRNQIVGGAGLANRALRFHALRPEMLRVFLFQPTTWVIPEALVLHRVLRGGVAFLILAAGPCLLLYHRLRRPPVSQDRAMSPLPWILSILILSYVGVLTFNSLFLDAGTTYDGIIRYLTPLFVLLVILELICYTELIQRARAAPAVSGIATVAVMVLMVLNAGETWGIARRSTSEMGFTAIRTEWADLASSLSAHWPDRPIISDNPELVYFLIDRPAYMIPIKFDVYQQESRADYAQQIELARDRLEAGAILVVFGEPSAEEAETLDLLAVTALETHPEAVIYGIGSEAIPAAFQAVRSHAARWCVGIPGSRTCG